MARKWATAVALLALAAALTISLALATRVKVESHDGAIDNHSQSKKRDTYEDFERPGVLSNAEEQALQEESKEISSEQAVAEAGAAADDEIWTQKELDPSKLTIFDPKELHAHVDDYYYILGVPASSDPNTIKAAYKKAALDRHPDKNGNTDEAKQNFQQLLNAYHVLSDPRKKWEYDTMLKLKYTKEAVKAWKAKASKWFAESSSSHYVNEAFANKKTE